MLNGKVPDLLKNFLTVGGMTFISRIFGFIRDVVIARFFGANIYTDAFFVAFRIPNLLRRLFAEGAFSQAFIPILSEYKNTKTEEETQLLINRVATLLSVVLIFVSLAAIVASPLIIYVSAPGFSGDANKFGITVSMFRICVPYILFISLTAFAGGILNIWGKFATPAVSPALLNLSLIVFAIWISPFFEVPIKALAWGVLFGGGLQPALQIPFLYKIGVMPKFSWAPRDLGVTRILKLMAPAILGVSVAQISLLINTVFASFLISGSISWLYYADRLMELPVGLLGAALSTTLLPRLSRDFADKNEIDYGKSIDSALRVAIVLGAPCALALSYLAEPLIATLFMYGEFESKDLFMTGRALFFYGFGVVALVMVRVLTSAFFGRQNTKTPVKIAIMTLFFTQMMNLIFVWPLGHAGLALAITLAAWFNVIMLAWSLKKTKLVFPMEGWCSLLLKIVTALIVMVSVLFFLNPPDLFWINSDLIDRIIRLSGLVVCGGGGYLAALWLMGLRFSDFGAFSTFRSS